MKSRFLGLPVAIFLLVVIAVVAALLRKGTGVLPIDEKESPVRTVAAPVEGPGSRTISPRPFEAVDAEIPSEAESRTATLEILVAEPAGTPARGARLVLLRGDQSLVAAARTDAEGIARFPGSEGDGILYVFADGFPMHVAPVSLAAGRRRVELPPGVAITGRVELQDQLPVSHATIYASPGVPPNLPLAVFVPLDMRPQARFNADAAGRFSFEGLSEGSAWNLMPALEHELVEVVVAGVAGVPSTTIAAPAHDVVLRVVRVPVLSGRVVRASDKRGVSGATVHLAVRAPDGRMYGKSLQTDGQGRFRLGLGPVSRAPETARSTLEVLVGDPKSLGKTTFTIDPAPESDRDLGDIEISGGRQIEFVVQDVSGKPIADARARVGERLDEDVRTDAQGNGTIPVADDEKSFWVGALRHAVAEVPIPTEIREPILVVLRPNSGIDVSLNAGGARVSAFHLKVKGSRLFPTEDGLSLDPILRASGAAQVSDGSGGDDHFEANFAFSADGRVTLAGLIPGTALGLEVVDAFGVVHASKSVDVRPEAWQAVTFEIAQRPRALRGIVRDRGGRPIAGVDVTIEADSEDLPATSEDSIEANGMSSDTDAEGRFQLAPIFVPKVHLTAQKTGFVTLAKRDVAIPPEGADLSLALVAGVAHVVRVVTPDGKPIRDLRLEVQVDGAQTLFATEKQHGSYHFEDLPPEGTITVSTRYAGRDWERAFPRAVDERESVITLPEVRLLTVDWEYRGSHPGPYRMIVNSRSPEGSHFDEPIWVYSEDTVRRGTHKFHAMLAGEYEVSLIRREWVDERPKDEILLAGEAVKVGAAEPAVVLLR